MSEQRVGRRVPVWAWVAGVVAFVAVVVAVQLVQYRRLQEREVEQKLARLEADLERGAFSFQPASIPAPPFALETMDGARFSTDEVKGQVVVVNFWATWCPPCRGEMRPMLRLGDELTRKYPGKFRMVAVSIDESWDLVRQFFAEAPFRRALTPAVTVVRDGPDQATTQAYFCGARGACPPSLQFPESYFVNKQGRIVGYIPGPTNWSDPAARRYLEGLIAE